MCEVHFICKVREKGSHFQVEKYTQASNKEQGQNLGINRWAVVNSTLIILLANGLLLLLLTL